MSLFAFLASLSSWLAASAGLGAAEPPQPLPAVRRVVIQDELILRIPVRPARPMPMVEWLERKGPKCLSSRTIAGAMLSGPSSIDFVLTDRSRVRARMDSDCPALDYYEGFYLQPRDDRICARRDEIKSRMGGSCRIEKFRALAPQAKH